MNSHTGSIFVSNYHEDMILRWTIHSDCPGKTEIYSTMMDLEDGYDFLNITGSDEGSDLYFKHSSCALDAINCQNLLLRIKRFHFEHDQ